MRCACAVLATSTLLACNTRPVVPFPTSVRPLAQTSLTMLEHQRFEKVFTFAARRAEFPEDTLRITATLVDAEGQTREATVSNVAHDTNEGRVRATLAFDSGPSGHGTLKIVVEPSIERVTLDVIVAADGRALRSFSEPLRCSFGLLRLRSGLTVCNFGASTRVARDGTTLAVLRGADTTIAGDALWITNFENRTLERYEGADGGLERTHVGALSSFIEGGVTFTQPNSAFRNGALFIANDAGSFFVSNERWNDTAPSFVGLIQGALTYRGSAGRLCSSPSNCTVLATNFVGSFDDGWWEFDPTANALIATTRRMSDGGISVMAMQAMPVPERLEPTRALFGRYRPVVDLDELLLVYDWVNDGGIKVYGFPGRDLRLVQAGDFGAFDLPDGGTQFIEFPR